MEKRTWIYVQEPATYCIRCDKCDGNNITWSEWQGMIWCYDCEVDTKGTEGIFDGPVAIGALAVLGISLDRVDLETGERLSPRINEDHKLVYEPTGQFLKLE